MPCLRGLWQNSQEDDNIGKQKIDSCLMLTECLLRSSVAIWPHGAYRNSESEQLQHGGTRKDLQNQVVAHLLCWSVGCGITTGGGINFHYKGIYRCAAGMGYTFQASQYMNGYHFYIKSISMGYLFHPKSIWMGTIWKMVYEWGQFSKIVYEWGQFSIWEVYEWVMFFTWPGLWMGWGSGTPAAHPYPKSWQVNPPPPHPWVLRHIQRYFSIIILKGQLSSFHI